MLAPTAERIDDALGRLSPDDRALLELSLQRGVSDDEIAALLHVHREHVEHRRELALERLAEDLDSDSRAEVAALVGQSMRANGHAHPAPESAPARRLTDLPPSQRTAARSRRRGIVIATGVLAAGLAALLIALAGGGSDSTPAPEPAAPAPTPPASGPRVALAPLAPGGSARGNARLRGSRLRLRISGLEAGPYAVWLFNDVSRARMVARFEGPRAALDVRLPSGFADYRSIDVSSEPPDGNPNHSGASVLRAPVAKLIGR